MSTTGDQIPDILSFSGKELNVWMSGFVFETQRNDVEAYPSKTLYKLCIGLLRIWQENDLHFNFLDGKNSQFYEFWKTLRARITELITPGVWSSTKKPQCKLQLRKRLLNLGINANDVLRLGFIISTFVHLLCISV